MLAGCVAALALFSPSNGADAQTATCTEAVRQALAEVGSWTEAECAPAEQGASPNALVNKQLQTSTTRCSEEAREALAKVGVWAEAQCDGSS
jgi:hypothetical protein